MYSECLRETLSEAIPGRVVLAVTSSPKTSQRGEEKNSLWVEIEKEWGQRERILGGICTQQLGLFMIWLRDCNSAQKRRRLVLGMGFNRKCGVTGERRAGKTG